MGEGAVMWLVSSKVNKEGAPGIAEMRARGRRGDNEGFSESPVEEAERPALAVTGDAPGYTSTRLKRGPLTYRATHMNAVPKACFILLLELCPCCQTALNGLIIVIRLLLSGSCEANGASV